MQNVTLAPPVDRLRTWQSIVDARLLNAITPPSSWRERAALRFSTLDLLRANSRERYQGAHVRQIDRTHKMRVSVKCNGYRGSVLAARDRDDALAAIFGPDRHRLLDALARPGNFDCDRYGNRFGSGRRCRIHAAIAGVTSVPPLVILSPNLAVIHRVPPVVIVVLPPMAFVIHRVVVAAKFKTGSPFPPPGPDTAAETEPLWQSPQMGSFS